MRVRIDYQTVVNSIFVKEKIQNTALGKYIIIEFQII